MFIAATAFATLSSFLNTTYAFVDLRSATSLPVITLPALGILPSWSTGTERRRTDATAPNGANAARSFLVLMVTGRFPTKIVRRSASPASSGAVAASPFFVDSETFFFFESFEGWRSSESESEPSEPSESLEDDEESSSSSESEAAAASRLPLLRFAPDPSFITAAAASYASSTLARSSARRAAADCLSLFLRRLPSSLSESLSESSSDAASRLEPPPRDACARSAARCAVAGRGAARTFGPFSAKALFFEKRPPPVSFLPSTASKIPIARVVVCARVAAAKFFRIGLSTSASVTRTVEQL